MSARRATHRNSQVGIHRTETVVGRRPGRVGFQSNRDRSMTRTTCFSVSSPSLGARERNFAYQMALHECGLSTIIPSALVLSNTSSEGLV
jgi:hypothetical protein